MTLLSSIERMPIVAAVLGCRHLRVSWPQGAKNAMPMQCCLDCGRVRAATIGTQGWVFGPWHSEIPRKAS